MSRPIKVGINKEGKYLCFSEVSSHASGPRYSGVWTSNLNQASDISHIGRTRGRWKDGGDPTGDIVLTLTALETRVVDITGFSNEPA